MKKIVLLSLSLFLIVLLSCNKSTGNSQTTTTNPPPPTGSTGDIIISGMSFPSSISIKAGETVTWTNGDYMSHTITSNTNAFVSGTLNYGDKFSYTFSTAGTFAYHCAFHPSMTGNIVVQ